MLRSSLHILLTLIFFIGCDELELNPLDVENNPDYEAPETTITTETLEGTTITTSSVDISWTGNESVTQYSFKLDSRDWSIWVHHSSVTLRYLDEGPHTFSVKSRYASMEEDETPANISFTVNAVTGPALMFYPRRTFTVQDSVVTLQILAEEVENLMLATISISFIDSLIDIESVSQGSFFTGTGESVFIDEMTTGSLTIYTMLLGGDSPSVSGTGILAEITVKGKALGSATLSLNENQVFKNNEDQSISIQEKVNGLVVVQ